MGCVKVACLRASVFAGTWHAARGRRPTTLAKTPMRPGDHPEFFRAPPPEGRSRESTLRLDASGRFWHDGAPVEHTGLAAALHRWIARHPGDGRYILNNGYDWTYFTVDDAPYSVRAVRLEPERMVLLLSDDSDEALRPETLEVGGDGALYARVKAGAPGGPFKAKFSRHAQTALGPALVETDRGPGLAIGGMVHPLPCPDSPGGRGIE
jgi:hypothetical protein